MPKFAQKSYGIIRDFGEKFGQKDIDLMKEFSPQYAQQGLDLTKQFAPQYAQAGYDITKQFAPKYAQTGFDIAKEFAPQYLGLNLNQMQQSIAGSPLLNELNKQAMSGLQLQGMPSEDELQRASQRQLSMFAQQGNPYGNQALAGDILTRDELVNQRKREAQQFAAGVNQMDLGQVQGLGGVAQMPNFAGYAQAPNLANYAAPPNIAAYASPGAGFGPLASGIGAVQGISGPLMSFGQNLFDANQNAAATQSIAGANKSAGLTGAGIGAAGSIGAALIGL